MIARKLSVAHPTIDKSAATEKVRPSRSLSILYTVIYPNRRMGIETVIRTCDGYQMPRLLTIKLVSVSTEPEPSSPPAARGWVRFPAIVSNIPVMRASPPALPESIVASRSLSVYKKMAKKDEPNGQTSAS